MNSMKSFWPKDFMNNLNSKIVIGLDLDMINANNMPTLALFQFRYGM